MSTMSTTLAELLSIMAKLRDPNGGCPWDLEQDFATIAPYTIEEAYEVAEAIHRGDPEELKQELGDLLLQVVFHAQMAKEKGWFDFHDVAQAIGEKMIRRHPHVFGDQKIETAEAQTANWEAIKAEERKAKSTSVLDDVPHALPALMRAEKLQKRAARLRFDWPEAAPVYDKIAEELDEVREAVGDADRLEDELGDLFFACANLARHYKVDPEEALRRANRKFERRFRAIEPGITPETTLEEMEAAWVRVKKSE
jgi:ATP diphosphatase